MQNFEHGLNFLPQHSRYKILGLAEFYSVDIKYWAWQNCIPLPKDPFGSTFVMPINSYSNVLAFLYGAFSSQLLTNSLCWNEFSCWPIAFMSHYPLQKKFSRCERHPFLRLLFGDPPKIIVFRLRIIFIISSEYESKFQS